MRRRADLMGTPPKTRSQYLLNGLRRRCPHCGREPLFRRWNRVRDGCNACGLRYLINPGDPWAFLLVIDRGALILPPIALIYFGLLPRDPVMIVALFAAFIAVVIYTTPHRYGICIALDVLTRGEHDAGPIGYPSRADPKASTTDKENQLGQR